MGRRALSGAERSAFQSFAAIANDRLSQNNWNIPYGGAAAVGTDSSRPPPVYRPATHTLIKFLKSIIGPAG